MKRHFTTDELPTRHLILSTPGDRVVIRDGFRSDLISGRPNGAKDVGMPSQSEATTRDRRLLADRNRPASFAGMDGHGMRMLRLAGRPSGASTNVTCTR